MTARSPRPCRPWSPALTTSSSRSTAFTRCPNPTRANNTLAANQPARCQPAALFTRHALHRFLHRRRPGPATTRSPCRPAGRCSVALASDASSGATALYISQGTLPTPYNYQEAADVANQPNQTVTVPQVSTAGTYYILAAERLGGRRHGWLHADGHPDRRPDRDPPSRPTPAATPAT